VFHWWYGFLERFVGKQKLSNNLSLALKLALNQLVLTPPFLALTLGFIQYFQTLSATQTTTMVRNTYAAALFTNWKVWTVAQAINFTAVPLDYRVLFGNFVALWWNIYLSLVN
jgi:protein Mpv17